MSDDNAQRPFDERLDRESGVFVQNDAHEVGCDPDEAACAPEDNYGTDPGAPETGIPGTADDIPMDFGQEITAPSDEHLVVESAAVASGESHEAADVREETGSVDENELWNRQQELLDEDKRTGLNLTGFPEEKVPEILEAMGDDAEEPLADYGNGVSATGEWNTPEHGGFPERD